MDTDLRILIVEDRPTDAERCERELRTAGLEFESRRVCTRESFLAALRTFSPDLILSDFATAEHFAGTTALKIARRNSPDIPFIFVSDAIGEERAVDAAKAGAAGCVVKDNLHRLAPVVRRALEEARERRRNEVKVLHTLAVELAAALEGLDREPLRGAVPCGNPAKRRSARRMRRDRGTGVTCSTAVPRSAPGSAARPRTYTKR